MSTPIATKTKKIHYLDGLRGYAALIVVFDHWLMMGRSDATTSATSVLWEAWFLRSPLRLLIDGGFAVAIFFVLSGYVLLQRYFKERHRADMLTSGMVRRYPRLMIPALASLLLYYSWLHFGPFPGYSGCHAVGELQNNQVIDPSGNYTLAFSIGDVVVNGLVGQWTFEPAIYTIQWTLQIELIGSLIVFGLALGMYYANLAPESYVRIGVYLFFFFLIPTLWWIGGDDLCPLPLQYVLTFLIGMVFAEWQSVGIMNRIIQWGRGKDNKRVFTILQITLVVFGCYFGTFPYQQTMGRVDNSFWLPLIWLSPWIWMSVGAGCIMFSLLTWKEFQDCLSTPLGQQLGRLSFSIYLLHYQVLILADILIMPWLAPAFNPPHSMDRTAAAVFLLPIFIFPLVFLVSDPFQRYCDEVSVVASNAFRELWLTYCPVCCKCLTAKAYSRPLAEEIADESSNNSATSSSATVEKPEKNLAVSQHRDDSVSDNPLAQQSRNDPESGVSLVVSSMLAPESGKISSESSSSKTPETSVSAPYAWLTDKPMLLVYFMALCLVVGAIPAKEYRNCYSPSADAVLQR